MSDSNIKILHVGWGHPPGMAAGPVYYVHNLCLEQIKNGLDPFCFVARVDQEISTGSPSISSMKYEGINYFLIGNRPVSYFDWENPAREVQNKDIEEVFIQFLRNYKPSIVHFHNLVGLSMSLPIIANDFGCRTVFSIHNYWMLCPRDDLFAPNEQICSGPADGARCAYCVGNPNKIIDFMIRTERSRYILNNKVDVILAVSEKVKQILIRFGIKENKIITQHIGSVAAEKNWKEIGANKIKDVNINSKIRFAIIGIITVRKGFHVVLEAINSLHERRREFFIEVYGGIADQFYLQRLQKLFYDNKFLQEVFIFKGPYVQNDMPYILKEIDMAIIPPIWEDNAPQTVMETLGAGVPIIGSRIGGIPDFIIDGKNGFLFEAGDPLDLSRIICNVLNNKNDIIKLKQNIRPPITMRQHVNELSIIYNNINKF